MTEWTKKVYNINSSTSAYTANINGIEASFLSRPDADTDMWKVRFDSNQHKGQFKILGISEESFTRIVNLKTTGEVINYLKEYIPYYIETNDSDFGKIPPSYHIDSTSKNKLPKIKDFKFEH